MITSTIVHIYSKGFRYSCMENVNENFCINFYRKKVHGSFNNRKNGKVYVNRMYTWMDKCILTH